MGVEKRVVKNAAKMMAGAPSAAGSAASEIHRMSMENQQMANDYAMNLRTKERAMDPTWQMSDEQLAQLNKYERAERAMESTDKGLSLVERNWKAVLIIFVILLVLYFIFRTRIKEGINKITGRIQQANKKNEIEQKNGQQCTLSDADFASIADTIQAVMGGFTDSENAVATQVCKCQNQADWDMLQQVYGSRKIGKDTLGIFNTKPMNLSGMISNYFDNAHDACAKIYTHFLTKKIKDEALLPYLYKHKDS